MGIVVLLPLCPLCICAYISTSLHVLNHTQNILFSCFSLTPSTFSFSLVPHYLYLRWLPTVLCAAHDKVLINAALGFDSYLVMRHGCSPITTTQTNPLTTPLTTSPHVPSNPTNIPATLTPPTPPLSQLQSTQFVKNESERLGCYFCSDIVAATNSQRDRSLDQQCTVTRYVLVQYR